MEVPILPQVARCEQLCYQIDAMPLLILPALKTLDNVWVLKIQAFRHFLYNLLQLFVAEMMRFGCYFAPSDINADLCVKGFVYLLEAAATDDFGVPEQKMTCTAVAIPQC